MGKHNSKGRKRKRKKRDDANRSHDDENNNKKDSRAMCFQDWFPQSPSSPDKRMATNDKRSENIDPAEAFFELANAPFVSYRLPPATNGRGQGSRKRRRLCDSSAKSDPHDNDGESGFISEDGRGKDDSDDNINTENHPPAIVTVKQDGECGSHTGGIVWETSYLLATFLLERYRTKQDIENYPADDCRPLGRVLELGSGCGMLGLILAASGLCKIVVSTETTEVMKNLQENIQRNIMCEKDKNRGSDSLLSPSPCCTPGSIVPKQLRWDKLDEDVEKHGDLAPHSFDTIIGTDVVFTTSLVKPLLQTMRKMSKEKTAIYLCLQIRCADSHELLLKEAPRFGFCVNDCSEKELKGLKSCSWGLEMDCKLLQFEVVGKGEMNDIYDDTKCSKRKKKKHKHDKKKGEKNDMVDNKLERKKRKKKKKK